MLKLDRYEGLKKLLDEEQTKIEEFIEKFKGLSIPELKKEFLSSVKYAKKMEGKIEQGKNDGNGHSYSVNAYAELCAKYTLLLYQYATLLVYNRNLEKQLVNPKQKKSKKRHIKMLERQMKSNIRNHKSRKKKKSD